MELIFLVLNFLLLVVKNINYLYKKDLENFCFLDPLSYSLLLSTLINKNNREIKNLVQILLIKTSSLTLTLIPTKYPKPTNHC